MNVTSYNKYGDLIGYSSLGTAIEIQGISNETSVYQSLVDHGVAIAYNACGDYIKLIKD